jgi:F-type H+-transporting ATPase subunit epsilon
MPIRLEIVTAERIVFSDEVDTVVVPGMSGQLGILPHHAPLMTTLSPGELIARKNNQDYSLAISGGFIEVRPDRIIILADSAERAEEIDISRAEAAIKQAQEQLSHPISPIESAAAEAALRRAMARIEVVDRRKRRKKPSV